MINRNTNMSNATSTTGGTPVYTTAEPKVKSENITQKELHATIIALNFFVSQQKKWQEEEKDPGKILQLADMMASATTAMHKLKAMLEGAGK